MILRALADAEIPWFQRPRDISEDPKGSAPRIVEGYVEA